MSLIEGPDWKLLLRTGFGNVYTNGRWDHASTVIIAAAVNSSDWARVIKWANATPWNDLLAD